MIVFRRLTFARAGETLVHEASLQIGPDWKVGVVGANGSGKSTLFALLTGEHHAETGDLSWPPDWVLAHVGQEVNASLQTALDFVLDGDKELRAIEIELQKIDPEDGERIALLHGRYAEIDGYGARARAAAMLHGLGFSDDDLQQPVMTFSGGWRMRLALAQSLMCRSDLLLLDEPTNHLDLDAVIWLEGWLKRYRGVLFVISHDRDFIDAVVDHTLCIERQQLKLYSGGYSELEQRRAEALALQQTMYEKQQREISHLQRFITRFRAKATKARQAQSRIKALERMERIAAAHVDTPFTFRFPDFGNAPDPLLLIDEADVAYGSQLILRQVKLTLRAGERIALLGRNGAGKSTLMKLLAGVLPPAQGMRCAGKGLTIGYFAQHQVDGLRSDESPLQHLIRLEPQTREQDLRDFLGSFDFRGDMATRPVGPFSGGEKSRLALALIVRQRPNLVLLDEPTNHLDLEMREALNLALQETDAGVVLVSHDRHLLRTTADQLYLVADGRIGEFDGDLDDYAKWLDEARRKENESSRYANQTNVVAAAQKQQRHQENVARKAQTAARRPLEREAAKLEVSLAALTVEKEQLEARLADPQLYEAAADKQRLTPLLDEQARLQRQIETAEDRWLEVLAALEAFAENSCR